jgi:heat shock protein HslJ
VNKGAGLARWEDFTLDPLEKSRASSNEANSAGISNRVLRSKEDGLASESDSNIWSATAQLSNDTLNLAGSSLTDRAFKREFNILNLCYFGRLEAVESASSLLLSASGHVECSNEALRVVDGAVLLAHAHILCLSDALSNGDWLEAVKSAACLVLEARLEVASGDEAFTEIDTAVLLADTDVILDLDLERLSFNSLKAVKSTAGLLLGASSHVEGSDEALTVVNAAVLLAGANALRDLDSMLNAHALEAIKRAASLLLEARLEVASGDEALSEVDTAVFLANAHISSNNGCNSATKCE